MDSDRRGANADDARQKTDNIADEDRLMKFDGVHGDRDERLPRPGLLFNFIEGADDAGLVDVAEQSAAKDGAQRVGVVGHHDGFKGQIASGRQCRH